jgi:hypothetical protein
MRGEEACGSWQSPRRPAVTAAAAAADRSLLPAPPQRKLTLLSLSSFPSHPHHQQLKELKQELGALRVAKVTGGAANKLSKMCVWSVFFLFPTRARLPAPDDPRSASLSLSPTCRSKHKKKQQ